MTQEEKQLLIKDICARLPYDVICHYNCVIPIEGSELHKANCKDILRGIVPMPDEHVGFMVGFDKVNALEGDIKPYLRPMSSMTEEEINEFILISETVLWLGNKRSTCILSLEQINWLNAHHFDHRGLIEKGLAIEAPEDMYKTE